ncbi:hypothetical protein LTR27_004342 [Elasticomyces elasticus]|nr:hypothetical protein LTR27_004342 [Elasticomyces elasticus]
MVQQIWLVTGCSSGFGAEFIKIILQRGDKAIATARRLESIKSLENQGAATLQLDVTAKPDVLADKIGQAIKIYGHIDVVVHNAGYGQLGALEDLSYDVLSAQFDTNVFGVMGLTQAVMPHFRERKSGCNVLVSSVGAFVNAPGMGAYCASKAAIEAMYRSLEGEVKPLGIKTLILQPGIFRTEIQNMKKASIAESKHHQGMMAGYSDFMTQGYGKFEGDPSKLAKLAVDLVKGEGSAEDKEIPLALPVGPDAYAMVKQRLELDLKNVEEWGVQIQATNYDGAGQGNGSAELPWSK